MSRTTASTFSFTAAISVACDDGLSWRLQSVQDLRVGGVGSGAIDTTNPFNPRTVITYDLSSSSHVTLKIYNVLGVEIKTLVDEVESAGVKSVTFDASTLTDGIYFYEIKAGSLKQVKKMVVMR